MEIMTYQEPETMSIQQHVLRWQQHQMRVAFDRELPGVLSDPNLELEVEYTMNTLLAKLGISVLVEDLKPFNATEVGTIEFNPPETWWDHFKQTYGNRWWMPFKGYRLARVRRKVTLTTTVYPMVGFPKMTRKYPDYLGHPVKYYTHTSHVDVEDME